MRKSWSILLLIAVLCLSLVACTDDGDSGVQETTLPGETEAPVIEGELVILFTGDVNGVFQSYDGPGHIGYAALAEYRDQLEDEGYTVVLIDGGDAYSAGDEYAQNLQEIIDAVGYDIRVPGEQELAGGVDKFLELTEESRAVYLGCNLIDGETGGIALDAYTIVDCGEFSVGFVGITTPKADTDAQVFYDTVQQAIDDAADAGAAYVVAVGHLGTDPTDSPWTSAEVIANTTGLCAFLDCHSGSLLEGNIVTDMDDFEIPVCAVGSEFCYVGRIDLDLGTGTAEVELLDILDGEDSRVKVLADDLSAAMEPTEADTEATEETAAEE